MLLISCDLLGNCVM